MAAWDCVDGCVGLHGWLLGLNRLCGPYHHSSKLAVRVTILHSGYCPHHLSSKVAAWDCAGSISWMGDLSGTYEWSPYKHRTSYVQPLESVASSELKNEKNYPFYGCVSHFQPLRVTKYSKSYLIFHLLIEWYWMLYRLKISYSRCQNVILFNVKKYPKRVIEHFRDKTLFTIFDCIFG